MTVLAETIKTNLATHHTFLLELKNFAQAQGWTVTDFRTNVQWALSGPTYDFLAGSESFLELDSTGHGSQALKFRFRTEAAGTDANNEWLQMGAFKSGESGFDVNSATHPVERVSNGNSNWNPHRYTGLKPTSIPRVFYYGNNKFIFCAIELTSTFLEFLSFGSIELDDTADDEGNWAGYINTSTSGREWYNQVQSTPLDERGDNILYDGGAKGFNDSAFNVQFTQGQPHTTLTGDWFRYGTIIHQNGYSNVRALQKPGVFIKHNSDAKWRFLGNIPVYRINSSNIAIGEEITYGAQKFRVFPQGKSIWTQGQAVRTV